MIERVDPWEIIGEWCAENAPQTSRAILPSAGDETIGWAERRSGSVPWPDDVVAFYQWCDGLERSPAGYLLPGFRPLSLREIVAEWEMLMEISFEALMPHAPPENPQEREAFFVQLTLDVPPVHEPSSDVAGAQAGEFVTHWLPMAEDQNGNYLMVDRRYKDKFGCLVTYDKVDADLYAASWPSLTALASAVVVALRTGEQVEGKRSRPCALGGVLTWS